MRLTVVGAAVVVLSLGLIARAEPPAGGNYVGNREPLAPAAFIKLPVGAVAPKGWLRHQLQLEADGECGHLDEISHFCQFDGNAWTTPGGKGKNGWEEVPYWIKGYGDLGYVLRDQRIMATSKKWIEAILNNQAADGYFGPAVGRTSLKGKPDLWPHMPVLNALQSYHEFTGDPRVIELMTKYFKYELGVPDADFITGYWDKMRTGDNLESVYWLYNRTGEKWLLDLATKLHNHSARWDGPDVPNWHNVNISQGFREPAEYFLQSRDKSNYDASVRCYDAVMGQYGQFPGGGFGGDENCRKGHYDPRQGFETCGIVEFMHSFEMLTRISGDPLWADRCEEIAFNSLPAAMTADLKSLHYLTCANQVQLDHLNKAPGIQNGGTMFSYSPHAYRCCQHNHGMGWPYFVEEAWSATADNGLAAQLYAPCEVTAKVADAKTVTIEETTDYPFGDTVTFKFTAGEATRFPLKLRIPRWCDAAKISVNGQPHAADAKPLSYVSIDREWKTGDVVSLQLPMRVTLRTWDRNHKAASVDYGPLTFSLKIAEKWQKYGSKSEAWPEWEVLPASPWNYGLVIEKDATLAVRRAEGPLAEQPFAPDKTPLSIVAKARKIAAWKVDGNSLIMPLQESPIKSDEPVEEVTLIPMGAARLRITAFPVIGDGADAHAWTDAPRGPLASHCFDGDTTAALNDGVIPKTSNDHSIPRFTWWDHKGTAEWVEYDFDQPRKITGVEVYWFDDSGKGACRVPLSWQVMYKDGTQWKPVAGAGAYGVALDRFNVVSFDPVETKGLRLVVKLQPRFSGGILEWRVK